MIRRHFLGVLLQNYRRMFPDAGDLAWIQPDLSVPPISEGPPRAGFRVRVGSGIYHVLYLPVDWQRGGSYPLIVEYPANGPGWFSPPAEANKGAAPEDTRLGYGISGGSEYIWLSLPFVDSRQPRIAPHWWGDEQATVDYCRTTVASVCREFDADPRRVLLCGFSRGSIACNYIGLHNDSIAGLWRAFVCHSHYDGVHRWPYRGSDRDSALQRLRRLNHRPQFISHEKGGDAMGRVYLKGRRPRYVGSIEETRRYLESTKAPGDFRFEVLPYAKHTDEWALRPIAFRTRLRDKGSPSIGLKP